MSKGYISVLGKEIPLYGLCFIAGVAMAACVATGLIKRRKIDGFDLAGSAVYTMIGALVGAKLLFIAVSWEQIRAYNLSFLEVIRGGFVFYGGLIGGAAGLLVYVKQFKLRLSDFLDIYATVLPLGHAFGRVGCFLGGCCYGMEMSSACFLCVVYDEPYNVLTPRGVPLLAVQLIEAACLVVYFVIMLVLFFKVKPLQGKLAPVYACAYAVLRFTLEFFRGDKERGGAFSFSTSQWISLAIFLTVAIIVMIKRMKNRGSK
ncbi:MAG: prolipoprotein diacylglyceryl transferase [Clostridia bacterium]|nr:prolipoprotein diacylglyceryl transferase [Clostridia bacterium]